MKKLMLLDGMSLINRAFYALPVLTTKSGLPTNAIIGFLNIYIKLMDEETPSHVAVAFDLPAKTFRHKLFDDYKATRKPFPDELKAQIPMLKDLLKAMDVAIVESEGYEADDILGTLSVLAQSNGYDVTIVSGDRDLLQLCSDKIKVTIPKTSKGQTIIENYYADDFIQKMGISPREYIDVKALMGDTSDNIPGVPSIGEKTAIKIIKEYGNIENAIENADKIKPAKASANLIEYAEQARLSFELAQIKLDAKVDVELEALCVGDMFNPDATEEYRKLELKSILKRAPESKAAKQQEAANSPTLPLGRVVDIDEWRSFISDINNWAAYRLAMDAGSVVGIGIMANDEAIYLPKPDKAALDAFFNSPCKKIAFDAKKDIAPLRALGIGFDNLYFDLLLAGYLLNAAKDGDSLNDLSLEYMGKSIDTAKINKESQISLLDNLEQTDEKEDASNEILAQLNAICQIWPIMEELLEQQELTKLYHDIEMPLIHVLADMEYWGIVCDVNFVTEYGKEFNAKIHQLTKEIHALAGEKFNINSTKQLAKVLFEDMGIKGVKKTKTGYSTNVEVLEKLAPHHEIAAKILKYRSYTKLQSTYVDGLLAATDQSGKIHTTFNQAITTTGRLSSIEPNLQNIPVRTPLGRQLRRAFVASSGFVFVDADYSQIELRVLAHLSQDATFLEAFRQNQDIHRITASRVFGVSTEEVTDDMRRIAKAVNFGIVYGISAFSLADDIKVGIKEAEGFINSYFAMYPSVKRYLDDVVEDAKQKGYAKTMFGRRRPLPELTQRNFATRSFGSRAAMNMPVQGAAADIIKIAMVSVHKRLKAERLESRLVLQVHDELLIETKLGEEDTVKGILLDEMQNCVKLSVPLSIDISMGNSWYDAK